MCRKIFIPITFALMLLAFGPQAWAQGGAGSGKYREAENARKAKNYKEAISVFRAMVAAAPNHPRTPEAVLAVANCQIEMKDTRAARKTLDDLIKAYPSSEAAAAGKERLGSLKG